MTRYLLSAGAGLLVLAATSPASAAPTVLDFTQGNYCNGGELCQNNAIVDNSYGDTAQVNLTYASLNPISLVETGGAHYYERGFGDLVGVLYGNRGDGFGLVSFEAAEGFEISLLSFDFGCFNGTPRCRSAFYELTSGSRFGEGEAYLGGNGMVATNYPSHASVTVDTGYRRNIYLRFGTHEDVGLDNIRFDVRAVAGSIPGAVPEPATWAMMVGGFGMIGAAMRRRSAPRAAIA